MAKFITCTCRVCKKNQTFRSESKEAKEILAKIDAAGWVDGPDCVGAYCSQEHADTHNIGRE